MIETLPSHLVHDILINLPVKSLVQFKCVSKACQSLTQDSSFVELRRARSIKHPQLLIQIQDDCDNSKIFLSPEDGFNGGVALQKVKIPWAKQARMLKQSIDGLFYFVDNSHCRTCIYNPGTGQVTPWVQTSVNIGIPADDPDAFCLRGGCVTQQPTFYGFGFDPLTNKYKVLCVWKISRPPTYVGMPSNNGLEYACEVFTVGENQWRRIDEVPPLVELDERPGVYANGSIYFKNAASYSFPQLIVAFDFGTEKFRAIEIPDFIFDISPGTRRIRSITRRRLGGVYLLQIDGHIALVDNTDVDLTRENQEFVVIKLWILSDDGIHNKEMMETNWTKETILLPYSCGIGRVIYPVQGTTEIVIQIPDYSSSPRSGCLSLYIYERITKKFRKIDITGLPPPLMSGFNYQLFIYFENLLPIHQKQVEEEEDTSEIVDMDFEYY